LPDRRALRAVLTGWWYSPSVYEIRAACLDTRRHPVLVVLVAVAVFWPLSGFTWLPLALAGGAWLAVVLVTRWVHWWWRWRLRRATLPAIGLATLGVLTAQAGPLAWGITLGLWLVIAGLTDTVRARRRLLAWVCQAVARAARIDPADLHPHSVEWDGRRLTWAAIDTHGQLRVEDQAVRDRVAGAVSWALRHVGGYTVAWPAGINAFEITADPALPTSVDEQHWPPDLPGIPVGVTDTANADGVVDTVDATTGEVLTSLPVLLVHPGDSQRHYLVVGGTGAGKSNFTRGFIARALRMGWLPGGCFIFDGKAGSDYIVFEGRDGVRCVAREPDEWEQNMAAVAAMMRARYDEDAAYHRGHTGKPDQPRWLVVLEEIQEIRTVLGRKVVDPFLQQISRQIRASNGRLMVVTQRPDTEDAIPGAVRDMLEERIILGFVSGTGARMVLDKDWQAVTDEYGQAPVPGRGMARITGHLVRLQSFRLDLPREHPELEAFYPPRSAQPAPEDTHRSGTLPTTTARWAPQPDQDADDDAPTPPTGVRTTPAPSTGSGRRPTV
jgi:heme exporter protein D